MKVSLVGPSPCLDPNNELIYCLIDVVQALLVFAILFFVFSDLKSFVALSILGLLFTVYLWRRREIK